MTGRGRILGSALLGLLLGVLVPATVLAHPLGNFTINHYAGLRIGTDRIDLDVVIDEAEIPTFTERQRIDTDGDGQVSDAEIEAERQVACGRLATQLALSVGGTTEQLTVAAAGLSFPEGAGGLSTMRLVCEFIATLAEPIAPGTSIHFADQSNVGRIGWREVTAVGDGAAVSGPAPAQSVSRRLTSYPQDLLSVPLATSEVTLVASPDGLAAPTQCISDAFPMDASPAAGALGYGCSGTTASTGGQGGGGTGGSTGSSGASGSTGSSGAGSASAIAAAVPGGVGREIADLLQTRDLTPPIVLISLLSAIGLGAAHALTPGHGKTVMAAYLVGTKGTARHAVGLGLTVTVSHTIGVLVLAFIVLAVSRVTPESFNHVTGIVSGLLVVAIGGWLFLRQGVPLLRRRFSAGAAHADDSHEHGHGHGDVHDHGHDHGNHVHDHGDHVHDPVEGHDHSHGDHVHDHGEDGDHDAVGMHSHGGVRHSHVPSTDAPLTWRSLFALGLFGGLVPSINALIILLATVASGRAGYGLVLVVAFGIGMAAVLGGIGLGLVYASRWMSRAPSSSRAARLVAWAPAITSVVILAVGLYVTGQALFGSPVL